MVKKKSTRKEVTRSWSPASDVFEFFLESKVAAVLMAVNFSVFVFLRYFAPDSLWELLVLSPENLWQGRIWTLITSGFVHQGWLHLFLNMLGLFVFGRVVEREMGAAKTAFIYLGALLISMAASTWIYALILHKNITIVGASGAVMGLVAAAMLWAPFSITYEMILPLPVMMKGWMFFYADLQGFLGGERDGVSHLAHLAGFLSVALLVYYLSRKDQTKMRVGLLINLVSFAVFLLLKHWFLLP